MVSNIELVIRLSFSSQYSIYTFKNKGLVGQVENNQATEKYRIWFIILQLSVLQPLYMLLV